MSFISKLFLAVFILVVLNCSAIAGSNLINQLDELISKADSASPKQFEAIKKEIEKNPNQALASLLEKVNLTTMPETNLAMYVWAMGLTKSPDAISEIIRISENDTSDILVQNSIQALSTIGGDKAGEYLLHKAKNTKDPMMQFSIFDLLAKMQYEPAIPFTAPILEQDPNEYYWQSIFIYGKYGDKAIPFLLTKLGDLDKNVKTNTIMILGQWLICPEAVAPFKEQYSQENDPEIRAMLLSSLEKTNSDLDDIISFSKKVLEQEKDEIVSQFAKETIANIENTKKYISSFKSKKIKNESEFKAQYSQLLNSYGKSGDYDKLAQTTVKSDESKLKKLKEVILQRNSDECFYDYQKINEIIMLNRMI